ncbi:hypothetical protein [Amycolatopsis palatopharyngis]|uniref:hypothetical protein n=1 Tax=Amycolatopsis palatopharyngis TaxID=187982 RepID=UPI0013BE9A69|nr:hypothetical protein [Amycolatopsis palatopharyngis]
MTPGAAMAMIGVFQLLLFVLGIGAVVAVVLVVVKLSKPRHVEYPPPQHPQQQPGSARPQYRQPPYLQRPPR